MIKFFSHYVFIFLLIVFLVSCKKDLENTKVKGVVLDAVKLTPISNATVRLKAKKRGCSLCIAGTEYFATTNSAGKFTLEFIADTNLSYLLFASKKNYFEDLSSPATVDIGQNLPKQLFLKPQGNLKMKIKNLTPNSNDDIVSIKAFNGISYVFIGEKTDTSVTETVLGNSTHKINWKIIKNGKFFSDSDSVYCPAFDTTIYSINY